MPIEPTLPLLAVSTAATLLLLVVVGLLVQLKRQRMDHEKVLNEALDKGRAATEAVRLQQHASEVNEATLRERLAVTDERLVAQEEQLRRLSHELDSERASLVQRREEISRLETQLQEQRQQADEKVKLLNEASDTMQAGFKNLAHEIFEAKQKEFKSQSAEQLTGVLEPLHERIRAFEKRVEQTYSHESRERFSLIKEVKNLQDLNSRIAQDAVNLTNALKGESKTQGIWGEVVLERVLEKSGLEKGREYDVQVALKNEEGRKLQPDAVVRLPEGKDVIVDAKMSLTAYERFCSSDDDEIRAVELKSHIQSIRQHIKQLSSKDYQALEGIRTLDFVLLFIPVEAAFSVAVTEDSELFSDAFAKNIVIVAPSTLLATLRTIQNIWRYEQQNRNAQVIAEKAGALYDKFVNFVADLEVIGGRLASTQNAYDDAFNKLASGRGNLVKRAEDIRALGAKVSKSLPQNLVEMPQRANLTTVDK